MSEVVFTVGDTEYKLRELKQEDYVQANKVYNTMFYKNLKEGSNVPLKEDVSKLLRDRGLWDDDKQAELDTISKEMEAVEKKLKKKKIKRSLATSLAIELRGLRDKYGQLMQVLSQYDNMTVEGIAENERFTYLVSVALVYNSNGKRVFSSLDDYNAHAAEEFAYTAAKKLMDREYSFIKTLQAELLENKFLKKLNRVDDELRLINEDGHLIDSQGRLITEQGQFVAYDKDGNQYEVDENGKKLEDLFDVESVEFVDG